jgi:hypothetical protein
MSYLFLISAFAVSIYNREQKKLSGCSFITFGFMFAHYLSIE